MKLPILFTVLFSLFVSGLPLSAKDNIDQSVHGVSIKDASAKIDDLVAGKLKENGIKPNEAITDETFIRRAYLDIAGRIPTIEEAENFQGSTYARKRQQLIRDLLESNGAVSHGYNFWADILRVNSALGTGAAQAEAAYQLWIKEAIKENKPYDEFVFDLVAARGKLWENGAVGYYIRDRGMPLDNMSNTVRVFLGTRLECAQCHNHPFDVWTQMDYFHMAAFSYGMDARRYDSENRKFLSKYQRDERTDYHQKAVNTKGFPMVTNMATLERYTSDPKKYQKYLDRYKMNDKQFRAAAKRSVEAFESYNHDTRQMRNAVNDLYNPLRYVQTSETEKTLKLPHDYQYDDAKPNDPVKPATMFGAEIDMENIDDSTIDAYAEWMTSSENPTFTKIIANRLWKRAFGHGIFEPVDDLTDQTPVTNPELLTYLEELMRNLDYDMRAYLEILYNTQTYQRGANSEELVMGMPYYFQGPVLRRMTAEQIWDSIVALALPEADDYRPKLKGQLSSVEKVKRIYHSLEDRDEDSYIKMVKAVAHAYESVKPKEEKIREKMYAAREAEDEDRYRSLNKELGELRKETRRIVSDIGYENVGEKVEEGELLLAMGMSEMALTMQDGEMMSGGNVENAVLTKLPKPEMPKYEKETAPEGLDRAKLKDWNRKQSSLEKAWVGQKKRDYQVYTSLVSQMARASELESPARRGHFLREFGQSDREVIENAAHHASVPQALNLLNGTIVEALTNEFAVFGNRIHKAGDPKEKINMIFQAMLTREPTEKEMAIALSELEANGDSAYEGIVWALLNTRQFIFVQ
ncbi:DUF1549 and DUF1553 domain-containing protein [Verrucomicrobiales bacterium]|jgi:hypothetical protein|nr:DUF1549 and DUF1553 domain-containing protein [Verrucomicrobiales bacterium]